MKKIKNKNNCISSLCLYVFFISTSLVYGQDFAITNTTFQGNDDGSLTHNSRTLGPVSTNSNLSQYGGWLDMQVDSGTGHFRTYFDTNTNAWYLLDPEGYLYFGMGPNSVKGESAYGGDVNLPEDLIDVGFNHIANWSDFPAINSGVQKIPYTFRPAASGGSGSSRLFMQGYKNDESVVNTNNDRTQAMWEEGIIPVFDPNFITYANWVAQNFVAPLNNDPYCIGVFSDNEMQIYDNDFAGLGFLLDRFLGIPDRIDIPNNLGNSDHNYLAAHNWMVSRNGGNTNYTITSQDRADFHGYLASSYYKICHDAIELYAPDKLYLGSRLHSAAKNFPEIYRDSAPYVDVFSVNYYGPFEPDINLLKMWEEESGKPFIISEFYAKGFDAVDAGGMPLNNTSGAGYHVPTQQDRVKYFENFVLDLLESKGCVGYQWFKFKDDSSNRGLIDANNDWYLPLQESIYNFNRDIYNLREYLLEIRNNLMIISVAKDTYISNRTDSNENTTVYGSADQMRARDASSFDRVSYVQFDLSSLSTDETIISAVLKFSARKGSSGSLTLYEFADDDWTESESFQSFSGTGGFGTFGDAINTTPIAIQNSDFKPYEVDITDYLASELSGDQILSLVITSNNDVRMGTKESDNGPGGTQTDRFAAFIEIQTSSLSVNEFNTSAFSLYPNPSDSKITIESKSTIKSVDVYSILGQRVLHFNKLNKNKIDLDLSAVNRGVYLVRVIDELGALSTKRFIKQ